MRYKAVNVYEDGLVESSGDWVLEFNEVSAELGGYMLLKPDGMIARRLKTKWSQRQYYIPESHPLFNIGLVYSDIYLGNTHRVGKRNISISGYLGKLGPLFDKYKER